MKPIDRLTDAELTDLAAAASRLPDAPGAWVDAAMGLWRTARPAGRADQSNLLTRIMAVLAFDSWAGPQLAFGMRSIASDSRHLLYSTEGRDVDVRVTRAGEQFSVCGQILGPDEAGEVELAGPGEREQTAGRWVTPLDDLGEFRLEGLDRGTYRLTLRMGRDEIVLPPITIGEKAT